MTKDSSENTSEVAIVPADHTDPALGYVTEESGETVVTTVNESFRDARPDRSVTGPSGQPLALLLDRWLADAAGSEIVAALTGEAPLPDTVTFDGESRPRLLQQTGAQRESAGHLVFIKIPVAGADATPVTPEALAQVVSHDLRNPLDVAKAHLRASVDAHPEDDHLETVLASHDRMEQIINDVLTLARGERALDRSKDVDLTAVLSDAWESVATADASLTIVDDLPVADADQRRLERLFENLLRNSIEHGTTGEPAAEPTVRAGRLEQPPGFYLADDGPGIPVTERTAVFEAGYSRTDNGTGLGLAIVERIATAHGWAVIITESKAGGARVEVHFQDSEEEQP